jgi:hypothetical protein
VLSRGTTIVGKLPVHDDRRDRDTVPALAMEQLLERSEKPVFFLKA